MSQYDPSRFDFDRDDIVHQLWEAHVAATPSVRKESYEFFFMMGSYAMFQLMAILGKLLQQEGTRDRAQEVVHRIAQEFDQWHAASGTDKT